MNAHLSKAAVP